MIKKVQSFFQGKKTHIIVSCAIIFNALWMAGVIEPDQKYIEAINYILVSLGLTTVKLGIERTK